MNRNINMDRICFYIPFVMNHHDRRSMTEIFNELELGQIDRVDFNLNKKFPDTAYSVFVHFFPYQNQRMIDIVYEHAENRPVRFDIPKIRGYRFGKPEHWMLMRAHNPVEDTCKNIHQINDNVSNLENTIERMQQTITSLVARINYLEEPAWLDDNELDTPLTMEDLAVQTSSNTHIRFPDSDTEKANIVDCPENDKEEDMDLDSVNEGSYTLDENMSFSSDDFSNEFSDEEEEYNLAEIHPELAPRTPSPEDDDMDESDNEEQEPWHLPLPIVEDNAFSMDSGNSNKPYSDFETRMMVPEWTIGTPNSNNNEMVYY